MPHKNLVDKIAQRKAYYEINKKAIRAQQAVYSSTHRKEAIARANKHREKVKGTAAYRFIWLKSQAKQRFLELNISFEEYSLLTASNRCTYCGSQLPIHGHGLDRIDNRMGYLLNNVTPCCTLCNTRKGLLEKIGFVYPRTVELLEELLK